MSLETSTWSHPISWSQPNNQETIILLMRHGETPGNDATNKDEYTMTGCRTNFELNDTGNKQADRVSEKVNSL